MQLVQRAFQEKHELELLEDGIKYTFRGPHGADEVFINYRHLTGAARKRTAGNASMFYIGWSLAVVTVIGAILNTIGTNIRSTNLVFWATCALLCFLYYAVTVKKYYLLEVRGGQQIFMLWDKPNKAEFETFLAELDARKTASREQAASREQVFAGHESSSKA